VKLFWEGVESGSVYQQNFLISIVGEDLPRDHGYPVRMLIPGRSVVLHAAVVGMQFSTTTNIFILLLIFYCVGHVGARQVKWLHKIRLSNEPSKKSYQCKSYLGFAPDITFEKDLAKWPPKRLDQAPISESKSCFASMPKLPSSCILVSNFLACNRCLV
jgi:hypothetical protein